MEGVVHALKEHKIACSVFDGGVSKTRLYVFCPGRVSWLPSRPLVAVRGVYKTKGTFLTGGCQPKSYAALKNAPKQGLLRETIRKTPNWAVFYPRKEKDRVK